MMSVVEAIRYGDERGRGLVAKRAISGGSVVLGPVKAVARVVTSAQRCAACWKLLAPSQMLRCARCKRVAFCAKDCQRREWKMHRFECGLMMRTRLPPALRLLLRLPSDAIRSLVDNMPLVSDERRHEWIELCQLLRIALDALGAFPGISVDEMVKKCAIMQCNAFTVHDDELMPVGTAIYAKPLCLINHSCVPNSMVVFDLESGLANVRALCPIDEREPIVVTYIELANPAWKRQDELLAGYCFTCRCTRCVTDNEGKDRVAIRNTEEELDHRIMQVRCSSLCEEEAQIHELESLLLEYRSSKFGRFMICRDLASLCISAQQWERAFAHLSECLKFGDLVYGRINNSRAIPCALMYLQHGKLGLYLGRIHAAQVSLKRALLQLRLVYGPIHRITLECSQLLADAGVDIDRIE